MRKIYNLTSVFLLSAAAALFTIMTLLSSCAVTQHQAKSNDVETSLFESDFKVAMANIDQDKFLLKDRNKLLYLLEKGKIEHLNGHYEKSNDYFEQAYILIDDKIKSSAGQFIVGKFTNAMAEPYKGEDFEKVTIHYYKALNYFQLGNPNEALIEAKRINIKLNALNDKYEKNKNKYSADAFSQIVQGVLYESVGDVNNAFIAYRNAEELYAANNDQYFGVPLPDQLKKDLIRTARQLGFTQEVNDYQKKFNLYPEPVKFVKPVAKTIVKKSAKGTKGAKNNKAADPEVPVAGKPIGEVIVFWENGLGPVKGQTKITLSGVTGASLGTFSDENNDIIIPVPAGVNIGLNAIAIPKYLPRESYYKKASVVIDGKEEYFELSQNFYNIAKQCLKDRMMREAIDIALRAASKKAASKGLSMVANHFLGSAASSITSLTADAVNVATEKADTRNWQTLPATISYLRIPLKAGDNSFLIKKYGANGIDVDSLRIKGKPGVQVMSYFDLGRTISPAPGAPAAIAASSAFTSGGTGTAVVPKPIVKRGPPGIYDQWIDAGKDISYKVTYKVKKAKDVDYYYKVVTLKNNSSKKAKVEFTFVEQQIDPASIPQNAMSGFAVMMMQGKGKISKSLPPGKEVEATAAWHMSDSYVMTVLSVE